MKDSLRRAAQEIRYLLDRGYPGQSAIRFVSDHHRLPEEDRFVLARVAVPSQVAEVRREKRTALENLHGEKLAVDGYNVLITVESLLGGVPVYLCDDGFLRDTRGVFRKYRSSDSTMPALENILAILKDCELAQVEVLLDQQISKSGQLAGTIRKKMAEFGVLGTAKTAKDVDRRLKSAKDVAVATGDGTIIDSVSRVVDLPAEVARRRKIQALVI